MKSPIIYNQLKNNFSQISNFALLDTNLSAKAYKLYAYMCYRIGLSDSWQFNTGEILKHFKEGDKAMRVAFRELIDAGFLERKRVRNEKGIFERTDYTIYAEPVNTGSDPQVQNRHVDNRRVDYPPVDTAAYNNKERKNKDSNNKDSLSIESLTPIVNKIIGERDFTIDIQKFIDWANREKKLKGSLENVLNSWIENPRNQIKNQKLTASLPSDPVGAAIVNYNKKKKELIEVFGTIETFLEERFGKLVGTQSGFELSPVEDFDVEKWREVLEKINVRIK